LPLIRQVGGKDIGILSGRAFEHGIGWFKSEDFHLFSFLSFAAVRGGVWTG